MSSSPLLLGMEVLFSFWLACGMFPRCHLCAIEADLVPGIWLLATPSVLLLYHPMVVSGSPSLFS